jgi:chain length determinant protein tyrosine kinase EpsG
MDKINMITRATEKEAGLSSAERQEPNIGNLLLNAGKIKPQDSERILKMQKEQNLRFGEAAIKLGLVTEGDIQQALAAQYKYAFLAPGDQNLSPELLAAYQPFTPEVESLRALRTQLKLRWFNEMHKHLAIIAPTEGCGCSFHAANLAVVFAQLGERTLLIDGNLRTPRQHLIFNLGNHGGLAEILGARVDHAPIVHPPKLGGLGVLPAGATPPNPGELLSRGTLHALLAQLDEHFDVILIDTPPAMPFTDAQAIAAACGGALLIAQQNRTRLDDLATIKENLTATGATIAGVVLNKF